MTFETAFDSHRCQREELGSLCAVWCGIESLTCLFSNSELYENADFSLLPLVFWKMIYFVPMAHGLYLVWVQVMLHKCLLLEDCLCTMLFWSLILLSWLVVVPFQWIPSRNVFKENPRFNKLAAVRLAFHWIQMSGLMLLHLFASLAWCVLLCLFESCFTKVRTLLVWFEDWFYLFWRLISWWCPKNVVAGIFLMLSLLGTWKSSDAASLRSWTWC